MTLSDDTNECAFCPKYFATQKQLNKHTAVRHNWLLANDSPSDGADDNSAQSGNNFNPVSGEVSVPVSSDYSAHSYSYPYPYPKSYSHSSRPTERVKPPPPTSGAASGARVQEVANIDSGCGDNGLVSDKSDSDNSNNDNDGNSSSNNDDDNLSDAGKLEHLDAIDTGTASGTTMAFAASTRLASRPRSGGPEAEPEVEAGEAFSAKCSAGSPYCGADHDEALSAEVPVSAAVAAACRPSSLCRRRSGLLERIREYQSGEAAAADDYIVPRRRPARVGLTPDSFTIQLGAKSHNSDPAARPTLTATQTRTRTRNEAADRFMQRQQPPAGSGTTAEPVVERQLAEKGAEEKNKSKNKNENENECANKSYERPELPLETCASVSVSNSDELRKRASDHVDRSEPAPEPEQAQARECCNKSTDYLGASDVIEKLNDPSGGRAASAAAAAAGSTSAGRCDGRDSRSLSLDRLRPPSSASGGGRDTDPDTDHSDESFESQIETTSGDSVVCRGGHAKTDAKYGAVRKGVADERDVDGAGPEGHLERRDKPERLPEQSSRERSLTADVDADAAASDAAAVSEVVCPLECTGDGVRQRALDSEADRTSRGASLADDEHYDTMAASDAAPDKSRTDEVSKRSNDKTQSQCRRPDSEPEAVRGRRLKSAEPGERALAVEADSGSGALESIGFRSESGFELLAAGTGTEANGAGVLGGASEAAAGVHLAAASGAESAKGKERSYILLTSSGVGGGSSRVATGGELIECCQHRISVGSGAGDVSQGGRAGSGRAADANNNELHGERAASAAGDSLSTSIGCSGAAAEDNQRKVAAGASREGGSGSEGALFVSPLPTKSSSTCQRLAVSDAVARAMLSEGAELSSRANDLELNSEHAFGAAPIESAPEGVALTGAVTGCKVAAAGAEQGGFEGLLDWGHSKGRAAYSLEPRETSAERERGGGDVDKEPDKSVSGRCQVSAAGGQELSGGGGGADTERGRMLDDLVGEPFITADAGRGDVDVDQSPTGYRSEMNEPVAPDVGGDTGTGGASGERISGRGGQADEPIIDSASGTMAAPAAAAASRQWPAPNERAAPRSDNGRHDSRATAARLRPPPEVRAAIDYGAESAGAIVVGRSLSAESERTPGPAPPVLDAACDEPSRSRLGSGRPRGGGDNKDDTNTDSAAADDKGEAQVVRREREQERERADEFGGGNCARDSSVGAPVEGGQICVGAVAAAAPQTPRARPKPILKRSSSNSDRAAPTTPTTTQTSQLERRKARSSERPLILSAHSNGNNTAVETAPTEGSIESKSESEPEPIAIGYDSDFSGAADALNERPEVGEQEQCIASDSQDSLEDGPPAARRRHRRKCLVRFSATHYVHELSPERDHYYPSGDNE